MYVDYRYGIIILYNYRVYRIRFYDEQYEHSVRRSIRYEYRYGPTVPVPYLPVLVCAVRYGDVMGNDTFYDYSTCTVYPKG